MSKPAPRYCKKVGTTYPLNLTEALEARLGIDLVECDLQGNPIETPKEAAPAPAPQPTGPGDEEILDAKENVKIKPAGYIMPDVSQHTAEHCRVAAYDLFGVKIRSKATDDAARKELAELLEAARSGTMKYDELRQKNLIIILEFIFGQNVSANLPKAECLDLLKQVAVG